MLIILLSPAKTFLNKIVINYLLSPLLTLFFHHYKMENGKFLNETKVKKAKRAHAFKGYASSYTIQILNSFDPELQLKYSECTIKNKLKKY